MNMAKKTSGLIFMAIMLTLVTCTSDPVIPINPTQDEVNTGRIELNFPMPVSYIPKKRVHRMDLSLARSADSLYRHQFYRIGNVSDYEQLYTFVLGPGRYFYQAGITCTAGADTCLWNDYPGGQYGIKWTMGWFTVEKGKTTTERIVFD
jgi:hypothetical protein